MYLAHLKTTVNRSNSLHSYPQLLLSSVFSLSYLLQYNTMCCIISFTPLSHMFSIIYISSLFLHLSTLSQLQCICPCLEQQFISPTSVMDPFIPQLSFTCKCQVYFFLTFLYAFQTILSSSHTSVSLSSTYFYVSTPFSCSSTCHFMSFCNHLLFFLIYSIHTPYLATYFPPF